MNIGIIGEWNRRRSRSRRVHRRASTRRSTKGDELREVGAGMMLWPNATRVLKELGVLEKVAALSGRTSISSFAPRWLDPDGYWMAIRRAALCTRRCDLLTH